MNIEGRNQVIEALKNDTTINKIYVDKNFMTRKDDVIALAKKSKIRIEFLPKKLLFENKNYTFVELFKG